MNQVSFLNLVECDRFYPFNNGNMPKELAFHGIIAIIYRGSGPFSNSLVSFLLKISFFNSEFSHVRNAVF